MEKQLEKIFDELQEIKISITDSQLKVRKSVKLVSDKVNYLLEKNDLQVNMIIDVLKKLDTKQQKQVLNYAEFLLSKN